MRIQDLTKEEAIDKLQQIADVLYRADDYEQLHRWLLYGVFYDALPFEPYDNEFDEECQRHLMLADLPDYFPRNCK